MLALVLTLLAACAPSMQRAGVAPHDFEGPRFNVAAQRFHTFDGTDLGLSAWSPAEEPWAVIVGLHGMNDYGEAFYPAGPWFAARGVAVYAYDARGQGRSPRRGVWGGTDLMTRDARAALAAARARHPHALIAVLGDSMGAATAVAAFSGDERPPYDRLVLAAPAVWGWSELPNLYAATLWAGAHVFPWREVSPPRGVARRIRPSDNIEMLRRIGRDPNMIFATRIDAIYGLVGLMERAANETGGLKGDVAFLYGARDQIIPRPAAERAAARLPAGARTALYAQGYHMLLRDLQAETVYADILSFLRDPAAPFPSGAPPLAEAARIQANR